MVSVTLTLSHTDAASIIFFIALDIDACRSLAECTFQKWPGSERNPHSLVDS